MAQTSIEEHPEYGRIIALAAGAIEVRIAPSRGSTIFSLTVDGIELIHVHPDRPLGADFTGNFCIYPVPNRVRNSIFVFEGTECSFEGLIPPRGNSVLVHGLVRNLAWDFDHPMIEGELAILSTRVHWDASRPEFKRFPFENILEHRITVSPVSVSIQYTATNLDSKHMPYGYALHPSFKRLSENMQVMLPARKVLEVDAELLPTGRLEEVKGKEGIDLNESQLVKGLDLDHVYTDLTGFPYIEYPDQDLRLTVESSEDFRFVVIHTRDPETLEIEPQTCSTDAFNASDPETAGLLILEPNSLRTGTISYRIEKFQ